MSIIKARHHCSALAVNYSGLVSLDLFQRFIITDQQDFVTFNGYQLSPRLGGVHSYYISILKDKVCGWHFEPNLLDLVAIKLVWYWQI